MYIAQKFARTVMRTNNVDVASNTRPEMLNPLREQLGTPPPPILSGTWKSPNGS